MVKIMMHPIIMEFFILVIVYYTNDPTAGCSTIYLVEQKVTSVVPSVTIERYIMRLVANRCSMARCLPLLIHKNR